MPRNGSGTAIPPVTVNPVSPGTTITSNWANTTVTDTYNELTNSLPRDGQAPMTAPLKIVDGSQSVPGLAFNSDSSTGLYRPVSNTLAVTVSGVEPMRAFSSGNIAIGSTAADARLLVSANSPSGTLPAVLPAGTMIHAVGADATTARITVDSFGSNAVFQGRRANGTMASPTAPAANDALVSWGGNGYNGSAWISGFAGGIFLDAAETFTPSATGTHLRFTTTTSGTTSSTEKMRLDNAGRLGIGTTPVAQLDLMGPVGSLNDTAGSVRIATDAAGTDVVGALGSGITFAQRWQASSGAVRVAGIFGVKDGGSGNFGGALAIYTQTPASGSDMAERARFTGGGRFGIGTTNPQQQLVVSNAGAQGLEIGPTIINSAPAVVAYNRTLGSYLQYTDVSSVRVWQTGSTPSETMRLDASGNLGIGVIPGAARFQSNDGNLKGVANASVHILGTATAGANDFQLLTARSAAGSGAYYSIQSVEQGSAYRDVVLQPSGGNVGIGTTTIAARLTVAGGGGVLVHSNGAAGYNVAQFINDGTKTLAVGVGGSTAAGWSQNAAHLGTSTNDPLLFGTNNTERARLTTTGGLLMTGSGPFISMDGASSASPPSGLNYGLFAHSSVGLGIASAVATSFWTNGSERMRIDSSGNVGIGGSPSNRLHILGGTTNTIYVVGAVADMQLQTTANGVEIGTPNNSNVLFKTNGAERFRINASGQLLPAADVTYSLGTSSSRWSTVFTPVISDGATATGTMLNSTGTTVQVGAGSSWQTLSLFTNNAERLRITSSGVIQDGAGNELGYKGLPAASVTTGAFAASDRGKCVYATAGVTVPNSTMATGDVVTIINTTASSITITASITTLTQAGTTNTGNRTLLANGICTVVFKSSTSALISGNIT